MNLVDFSVHYGISHGTVTSFKVYHSLRCHNNQGTILIQWHSIYVIPANEAGAEMTHLLYSLTVCAVKLCNQIA